MKLNVLGVASVVLAFISLALPWWEISASYPGGRFFSLVYLWGSSTDGRFRPHIAAIDYLGPVVLTPFIALALIVIGGVLGAIASITVTEKGKTLLAVAGTLSISSIIVFAAGRYTMSRITTIGPLELSISEYPSFGFWLALIAAIIAFAAYMKYPKVT